MLHLNSNTSAAAPSGTTKPLAIAKR